MNPGFALVGGGVATCLFLSIWVSPRVQKVKAHAKVEKNNYLVISRARDESSVLLLFPDAIVCFIFKKKSL